MWSNCFNNPQKGNNNRQKWAWFRKNTFIPFHLETNPLTSPNIKAWAPVPTFTNSIIDANSSIGTNYCSHQTSKEWLSSAFSNPPSHLGTSQVRDRYPGYMQCWCQWFLLIQRHVQLHQQEHNTNAVVWEVELNGGRDHSWCCDGVETN